MQRRDILRAGCGLVGTAILMGCGKHAADTTSMDLPILYPDVPKLSGYPPERRVVHQLLEELRLSYEARGSRVSGGLKAALSENEIDERCAWFPGTLAEEIYSLYSWRGGQEISSEDQSPFWFRDVIFSTPEAAALQYKSMIETYGKLMPQSLVGVDLSFCFPFAAFSGGWYVFPCAGQALNRRFSRPIISVLQGVDAYYNSLDSLLKTCIAWVKHPAYGSQGRAWDEVEMEIWERLNPGVFEKEG